MVYLNDVIMLHIVINKSVESIINELTINLIHNIPIKYYRKPQS